MPSPEYCCRNTVLQGSVSSSPSAFIWITPAFRAPKSNLFFVRNAAHFLLVAPPGRLSVRRLSECVFRVRVSSVLLLHSSMAAAERYAASLTQTQVADASVVAAVPRDAASCWRWARDNPAFTAASRGHQIVRDFEGHTLSAIPGANARLVANGPTPSSSSRLDAMNDPPSTQPPNPIPKPPYILSCSKTKTLHKQTTETSPSFQRLLPLCFPPPTTK